MRIDLIPHLELINEDELSGKTVIVLDILRATSTMVTAMENGARQIFPVATVTDAEKLKLASPDIVLSGEREGVKIKGFHLGNSPLEFTHVRINNKTLAHCTTNGTKAILLCTHAHKIILGSLLNRAAAVDYAIAQQTDIVLVCAGRRGGPAIEDSIGAGAFVQLLRNSPHHHTCGKLPMEAYYLYKCLYNNIHDEIYKSPSGQNLISMGLKVDIDFCLRTDVFNVVPIYSDGGIVAASG